MAAKRFSKADQRYLAALPAVASVTSTRIYYSESFRKAVMERYHKGERPAALFREAGLDPKRIGYKRIERCIARWKQDEQRGSENDSASEDAKP